MKISFKAFWQADATRAYLRAGYLLGRWKQEELKARAFLDYADSLYAVARKYPDLFPEGDQPKHRLLKSVQS